MKLTQEKLEELAITYINSDYTIGGLADLNGIAKTTLVRYFSGAGKIKLSPELQKKLNKVKQDKWSAGKSTNGNLGHKKYDDAEIVEIATKMVEENLTLRDLALDTAASLGTLYGRFNEKTLGTELYEKVVGQYDKNMEIRTVPRKNREDLSGESDASQLSSMVDEAVTPTMAKKGKSK